ncbi:FtsX-like permease family protein [Nocardiopsis potens]|uniref:FtsX-like permease family protein n=1 Tax=Nocardiopsis potens TaxID=1246458 RepID=UPI000347BA61|nr:ABC transporter permease [Nocardiopsis potens]
MIWIAVRTLRDRWPSFAGSLLIIALGAAQISAVGLTMQAAGRDGRDFSGALNLLGMTMLITTFVSVFVIASTFAYSVAQRRREFALLRSLGAGPVRVRAVLYGEALLVAAVGGAAGCALSLPLAEGLLRLMHAAGIAPGVPEVRYEAVPMALAACTGTAVALAGVWGPARRIRRIRPIEALREASVDTGAMTLGRWVLGLGATGLAVLAGYGLVNATGDGAVPLTMALGMVSIVAAAFLAPVVVPPVAAALALPAALLPGAGALVVRENMRTAVRRTASLCAPVLLTVGLSGVLAGAVSLTSASMARATAEWTSADLVVTATGPGGLSGGTVDRLRAVPGAELAVLDVAEAGLGPVSAPVAFAEPGALARAIDPPAVRGSLSDLDEGGLVLDPLAAAETGLDVGDRVEVRLPGGARAELRVRGVLAEGNWNATSYAAVPPGSAVAEAAAAAGPEGPGATFLYASAGPGTGPEELRGALEEALGGAAARVDAVGEVEPGRQENDRMVAVLGGLVLGMGLFCSCLAIANTLVMSASDRARDLGALRLAGATGGQVLRMVAAEAAAVVALGALLAWGVVIGVLAVLHRALSAGVDGLPLAVPWGPLLALTGVCAAIALPSAVLPARAVLRRSASLTGVRE